MVDDCATDRDQVAEALRAEGFEVLEAASGGDALVLTRRFAPDVVVLDIRLPDADGFEVCRALKAASLGLLPVLHLSSSSASEQSRTRGLDAGADSYLARPFDPSELRAAVNSLVRIKRGDADLEHQAAATSLLQEALDALADHIALLGPTGDVIAVNRAWAEFAEANGYRQSGTGLGVNYCGACNHAAGPGADDAKLAAEGIRRVLAREIAEYEQEYACHSPTEERWFRMAVRRVVRPGPVAAIVTHTSLTREREAVRSEAAAREKAAVEQQARYHSDTRFRQFVETTHEGVLAMNAIGVITYANPRIGALLGCTREYLVGRSYFAFMPPEADFAARTRFAGRSRGKSAGVEGQMQHCDGTIVHVLASESPIVDEHGETVGVLAMVSDVTERKRVESAVAGALRDADLDRRRLEATLRAIPVGVWLADASGRLTHSNPAADRIWGGMVPRMRAEDDALHTAWWPDTGLRVAPEAWALTRTLATRQTVAGDIIEIERLDGTRGFILNSSAPILDASGKLTGGVVVNVDITEHQAATRERERLLASLQIERAHMTAIFEQAPAFLAVMRGPDHVFERMNPACQALIGQRDVIGKSIAEALPELRDQGFIEILDRVRAFGDSFVVRQMSMQLARTRGALQETRYVNMVYQRLFDAGGDHSIVWHGVDITEQVLATASVHQNEQRLRDQFAKLPVPTYLWEERGDDFVLVDCNQAALNALPQFGRDVFGKGSRQIFPGMEDLGDDVRRSLRDDVVVRRTVEVDVGPSMGKRRFELTIGPQQPDRVLLHAIDTTERSELEGQLRQAQKMEAIGQLAGGVAHDFNNLLTVIGAHSSFLLESLDVTDPQHEDAVAIHKAGIRAAGLTRQLLAFSRKQILKPLVIDLNATVEETRKMLERLLGEDIEIVTKLGAGLQHIVADPSQIDQVIVNLAVNARDAMEGGGRLTLTTCMTTIQPNTPGSRSVIPAGKYVELAVRDTGEGMNAAVQARLFEPFFTTKGPGKGTGLGLATVYGIVKQSGGYITAESTLGKGSTFHVYLPAVVAEEELDQLEEAKRAVARGVETVLLVEDEPAVREVARRVLQRHGYHVLEAQNGETALAVSAGYDAKIHLVISDAVMPGMRGAEVVRRLQSQRPMLKALFMSGYTDDEIVRRGIVAAAVPFVQKPFTSADFARAVREVLDA